MRLHIGTIPDMPRILGECVLRQYILHERACFDFLYNYLLVPIDLTLEDNMEDNTIYHGTLLY